MKRYHSYAYIFTLSVLVLGCSSGGRTQINGLSQFKSCDEMDRYLLGLQKKSLQMSEEGRAEAMNSFQDIAADRDLQEGDLVATYENLLIYATASKLYFIRDQVGQPLEILKTVDSSEGSVNREILVMGDKLLKISVKEIIDDFPGVQLESYDLKSTDFVRLSAKQFPAATYLSVRLSKSGQSAKLILTKHSSIYVQSDQAANQNLGRGIIPKAFSATSSDEGVAICDCENVRYLPYDVAVPEMSLLTIQDVTLTADDILMREEFSLLDGAPVIRSTEDSFLLAAMMHSAGQHVDLESGNTLNGVRQSLLIRLKEGSTGLKMSSQGFVSGRVQEASNMRANGNHAHIFSVVRDDDLFTPGVGKPAIFRINPIESRLSSYKESSGKLERVDEIKELGKDQNLYATKFVGDRAYAITAQDVVSSSQNLCAIYPYDPYMIFDLKNPLEPQLIGSLDLPGYTRQLLPLGSGNILGLGRAEDGSIQTSLFAGESATLLDQEILAAPASQSAAAGNGFWSIGDDSYKSYEFDGADGLLAFPLTDRESCDPDDPRPITESVRFIRADGDEITDLGRLVGFTDTVNRVLLRGEVVLGFSANEILKSSRLTPTQEIERLNLAE